MLGEMDAQQNTARRGEALTNRHFLEHSGRGNRGSRGIKLIRFALVALAVCLLLPIMSILALTPVFGAPIEVKADYDALPSTTYTVTFVDSDDRVISTQTVTEGNNAIAPQVSTRSGYTFTGWDKAFTNITSNLTIRATYTAIAPITYTVVFSPGEQGGFVSQITSGLLAGDATPQAPQTGAGTSWRFIGWQPAVTPYVTGNATYTAQWELVTTPPDLSRSAIQSPASVSATQAPTVVNVSTATESTTPLPDRDTAQAPSSTSPGAGADSSKDTDAMDAQGQALSDDKAPLAGDGADVANGPVGPNVPLFLFALAFLTCLLVAGCVFMARTQYYY
jgi:uncharacterized repeat protein (TIGR02543 family)